MLEGGSGGDYVIAFFSAASVFRLYNIQLPPIISIYLIVKRKTLVVDVEKGKNPSFSIVNYAHVLLTDKIDYLIARVFVLNIALPWQTHEEKILFHCKGSLNVIQYTHLI